MTSYRGKFATLFLGTVFLAGCFSGGGDDDATVISSPPVRSASAGPSSLPVERGTNHVTVEPGQVALQCVPYARDHSAVKLSGDASGWWDKAAGKYERGHSPTAGVVMVLHNYSGSTSGHVAVVRRVVSSREIRVDHANWLNDGSIYVNDPVVDVSAANDWSKVKVWNIKTGSWGVKEFPVQGFIGTGTGSSSPAPQHDDENDAAPPPDALVADVAPPPPVRRVAMAAPARPKAKVVKAVATRTVNPVIPASLSSDDLNPAADSGFALTDADRAIP